MPQKFAHSEFLHIDRLFEVVCKGMTERVEVLALLTLTNANILAVGAIKPLRERLPMTDWRLS